MCTLWYHEQLHLLHMESVLQSDSTNRIVVHCMQYYIIDVFANTYDQSASGNKCNLQNILMN